MPFSLFPYLRPGRWQLPAWGALLLALLFFPGRAAAGSDLELTVKSAYIYNFVQFVEWPGGKNNGDPGPVRICLTGRGPMAAALAGLASRKVQGRGIEVLPEMGESEGLATCAVVVIDPGEDARLPKILAQLAGAQVLTVSDIPGFASRGGGIGFVLREGKVKLEINPRVLSQAGLKVSAKLLEVAHLVE